MVRVKDIKFDANIMDAHAAEPACVTPPCLHLCFSALMFFLFILMSHCVVCAHSEKLVIANADEDLSAIQNQAQPALL
jgi:hypothetical protein